MVDNHLLQILLQVIITVVFTYLCMVIGTVICNLCSTQSEERQGKSFYSLLTGLMVLVSCYAIANSLLISVFTLVTLTALLVLPFQKPILVSGILSGLNKI